ncbi:MAG: hypothetical protein A4E39_02040 [Methanoregulaceae archaeon PtaB.Bin152]|nr:MAG: hypothetical protein A4E39_02040 [Methanoregulaceae archaeon PtaB.Bin152]
MELRYPRDTIRNISSVLIRHPAFLGATIGILAAFSQALLISAGGPEAYGFCVACHTRDLVNGMTNIVAGTSLALAAISKNSLLPVMSVAGVLIGGYISATLHREHRIKKGTRIEYLWYFLAAAILFIVAMAAGVILGAYLMLKKAEREDA